MGLTIAQLSERLRCAECGGQLHSVKPWRLDDVIGKPLERRVERHRLIPAALFMQRDSQAT
jgi:hypothetical protein